MARGQHVKREPGTGPSPAHVTPKRPVASLSQETQLPRGYSPTLGVPTESPSERRAARSFAPSIDTRPQASLAESHREAEAEDHSDVVLMEVRRRVKPMPEEDRQNFPPNNNDSFMSNSHAFQAIGQKLREVNDTLGTLQSLGIQHVAELPELVLVGDQSAGKSSIMSAIAGLNLPHNTGVCTRCPIHIRSSRSVNAEWSCRITLQQDYAFVPGDTPITQDDVTIQNPFPPWVKQHRVVKDFMTIRDKVDSIERVLRWAQIAILNHNQNHELYIPKDEAGEDDADHLTRAEERTEAKFSPNTVALEIRGPDLPDLSFYDLPGVFVTAPNEQDQYLAHVVRNLTQEYISHPGAIILWAVPMNNDADTSSAFSIIRGMGAEERCLGVMTKADLLPRGSHSQWISMLQGVGHATGLGYFITSRPDTGDLDEQAAWEEAFFNRRARLPSHSEQPVWPPEFADFEERCGVLRLKDFLSRKLAEDFAKSLPEVKNILHQRLNTVVTQLKKLPELPANPELEIRKGLLDFANIVKTRLKGQEFSTQWAVRAEDFKKSILAMKPKVVVKPENSVSSVIDLDSDSVASRSSPQPKRRTTTDHYSEVQATPSKRRGNGSFMSGANGTNGVKAEEPSPSPYQFTPRGPRFSAAPTVGPSPGNTVARSRTLPQIREILVSKRRPGMPNAIPYEVYEFLCMDAVKPWNKPLSTFLNATMQLLQKEAMSSLDQAFSNLKKRLVFREAKKHLGDFIKGHRETLTAQLMHTYRTETFRLYTVNNAFFNHNLEEEKRILARHRHHYRWAAHIGQASESLKPLDKLNEEERVQEQSRMQKEANKMGKDMYEQELDVVAYVRGYYLTAAFRFIDNVSLQMTSGIFPSISESVDFHLDRKLGLLDSADQALFDSLMEEEPKTADLRKQLKDDKKKFDEAMACILALEKSAGAPDDDTDADNLLDTQDDLVLDLEPSNTGAASEFGEAEMF